MQRFHFWGKQGWPGNLHGPHHQVLTMEAGWVLKTTDEGSKVVLRTQRQRQVTSAVCLFGEEYMREKVQVWTLKHSLEGTVEWNVGGWKGKLGFKCWSWRCCRFCVVYWRRKAGFLFEFSHFLSLSYFETLFDISDRLFTAAAGHLAKYYMYLLFFWGKKKPNIIWLIYEQINNVAFQFPFW